MVKYVLKRLLHGIISVIIVVAIVMLLVYSLIDRESVFNGDPKLSKLQDNALIVYKYSQLEKYGYIDYVPYSDWINEQVAKGNIDPSDRDEIAQFGRTKEQDSELTTVWVKKFTEFFESQNYTVERKDASVYHGKLLSGGAQQFYAYKNISVFVRLWNYFTHLIFFDNIHYADGEIENRGLSFTFFDPAYGGKVFSPAIMGNGTKYKYLLYFDNKFPFIHQNLITFQLGTSYSVYRDIEVVTTMTQSQGNNVVSDVIYPTGFSEPSSVDLHSAQYLKGSLAEGGEFVADRYVDDYTVTNANKDGKSKIGYSFIIGIISVILAYFLGVPLGIVMARNKDKFIDKIGTIYIVFIIAVPSLAYIFLFKSVGGKMGFPTAFNVTAETMWMYVLPIISLALPSIAGLMKWMRRYMIDQGNADYVKFARSGGLSEGEIFRKHIVKNAIIPIVHGIPGSVLGALIGGIITERVYVVPGTGNLLTRAINAYDNGVIVGITLFYSILSIVAIILGDILMSMVDPRISYVSKGR